MLFISFVYFAYDITVEIGDKRGSHGGSAYSGHKRVLYWADATSQLTFVVPTNQRLHPPVKQTAGNYIFLLC